VLVYRNAEITKRLCFVVFNVVLGWSTSIRWFTLQCAWWMYCPSGTVSQQEDLYCQCRG